MFFGRNRCAVKIIDTKLCGYVGSEGLPFGRLSDSSPVGVEICINQKDADEKSQQVRIMSDSYKNATHVVVSLGEPSPETDAATDSIYPPSKVISQIEKDIDGQRRGAQPHELEEWKPIGPLLLRPWFERILGCTRSRCRTRTSDHMRKASRGLAYLLLGLGWNYKA